METHPPGQERGLEGNQARTQQPESRGRGHGGRGDFAAFAHQTAYLHQQEQILPDYHQAHLESRHAGFLSDRDFVPPHSGSDVAESSRHFLNYASLLEATPDPDLQALLDPLPTQAHPESSRTGHSSESALGPLPSFIQMYRSLQRYENYLRQDTYDRARPPEAFLRPFSSLIKAKKTIIQAIIRYLDQRLRSNNEYLSTLQQQITDIENQKASLDEQLETNKRLTPLLKLGPRYNLLDNIQQAEKQSAQLSTQQQEASHKYQQAEIKLFRENHEYIQKIQELQQRLTYYHTLYEASNKYYPQREGQHSPSPDDDLLKHLREYAWEPDPPAMINNRLLDNTIPGIESNSLIHSLIRAADKIPPEFMAEASQESREQLLQQGIAQNQMLTREEITNVIHFLREQELLDGRAVRVYSYIKQAVGDSVEPYLASFNYAEALAGSEKLDPIEIFFHQQTQHYSALLSETQGHGSAEKDLTAQNTTREDLYSSVASNILSENVHLNPQEITRENVHPSLAIDVPPQDRITNPPGTTFEDPSSSLVGSHGEETHSSLAPFESKGTDIPSNQSSVHPLSDFNFAESSLFPSSSEANLQAGTDLGPYSFAFQHTGFDSASLIQQYSNHNFTPFTYEQSNFNPQALQDTYLVPIPDVAGSYLQPAPGNESPPYIYSDPDPFSSSGTGFPSDAGSVHPLSGLNSTESFLRLLDPTASLQADTDPSPYSFAFQHTGFDSASFIQQYPDPGLPPFISEHDGLQLQALQTPYLVPNPDVEIDPQSGSYPQSILSPEAFPASQSSPAPVDRSSEGPSSDSSHRRKRPSELPSNPEENRSPQKRRTSIFEGYSCDALNEMCHALKCSEEYLKQDQYHNPHQLSSIIKVLKITINTIIERHNKMIEEKKILLDPDQAKTRSEKNQKYRQKIEKLQQELNSYTNKYPTEREEQHSPSPDDDILKRLQEYAWEPDPPAMINNRPLDHTIPGIGNNCLIHSIMRASGETSPQSIQEAIQRARASLTQQGIAQEHPMLEQPQYTAIINSLRQQRIIDGRRAVRVYHYTNQKAGNSVEPYSLTSDNYAEAHPGSEHLDPIEIFLHQRTQHYSIICPETNIVFDGINILDNINVSELRWSINRLNANFKYYTLKSRKEENNDLNIEEEKQYQEYHGALTCMKNIQGKINKSPEFKEINLQEQIKKLLDILLETNIEAVINNSHSLLKQDLLNALERKQIHNLITKIENIDNINISGLFKAISHIKDTNEYKDLKSRKEKGEHLNEEDKKKYQEYHGALTCMENIWLVLTGKLKGKEINLQEQIKNLSNIFLETNIEYIKTRAFLLLQKTRKPPHPGETGAEKASFPATELVEISSDDEA